MSLNCSQQVTPIMVTQPIIIVRYKTIKSGFKNSPISLTGTNVLASQGHRLEIFCGVQPKVGTALGKNGPTLLAGNFWVKKPGQTGAKSISILK